jgi:hypothetical protein
VAAIGGSLDQNSTFNVFFKVMFGVGMLLVIGFALEMFGYSTPATAWISEYFFRYE